MHERYRHTTAVLDLTVKWHIWSYTAKPRQQAWHMTAKQEEREQSGEHGFYVFHKIIQWQLHYTIILDCSFLYPPLRSVAVG